MNENSGLSNEIQNMRFMLQDKESYIKRLTFIIEREKNDKLEGVTGGI
jgi:hypothetical protein